MIQAFPETLPITKCIRLHFYDRMTNYSKGKKGDTH